MEPGYSPSGAAQSRPVTRGKALVSASVIFGNDPLSIAVNPFLPARDEQVLLTTNSIAHLPKPAGRKHCRVWLAATPSPPNMVPDMGRIGRVPISPMISD